MNPEPYYLPSSRYKLIYTTVSSAQITWSLSSDEVSRRLAEAEKAVIKRLEEEPLARIKKMPKRRPKVYRPEIRGFRPEKYPRKLLWQKHAKEIRERMIIPLLQEVWETVMKENNLRPVSQPKATSVEPPEHGKPLDLTIDVNIWPQPKIDPLRYANLRLMVPAREIVMDAQVDQKVEEKRRYYAEYQVVEGEAEIQSGDYVQLRISEKGVNDPDYPPEQGIWLVLGCGGINPTLEPALIGRKKGEEVVVTVARAEDGQEIDVRIRIDDHKRGVLPTEEEICANENVYDMISLKERIRAEMQEQIDVRHKTLLRRGIMNQIIGLDLIPIPQTIGMERARILEQEMRFRAMKAAMPYDDSPENRKKILQLADCVLREEAVLQSIAAREGISVSQQELDTEIARIARRDEISVDDVLAQVQTDGIMDKIKEQCLTNKTLDWLISRAKINEVVAI